MKRNGKYLSPKDAFDERRSEDLILKADYSYKNAKGFVDEYFGLPKIFSLSSLLLTLLIF